MRQLHVREPWADLAYSSDPQLIQDLVARIQVLEAKIRDLEMRVTQQGMNEQVDEEIREAIPVGV